MSAKAARRAKLWRIAEALFGVLRLLACFAGGLRVGGEQVARPQSPVSAKTERGVAGCPRGGGSARSPKKVD